MVAGQEAPSPPAEVLLDYALGRQFPVRPQVRDDARSDDPERQARARRQLEALLEPQVSPAFVLLRHGMMRTDMTSLDDDRDWLTGWIPRSLRWSRAWREQVPLLKRLMAHTWFSIILFTVALSLVGAGTALQAAEAATAWWRIGASLLSLVAAAWLGAIFQALHLIEVAFDAETYSPADDWRYIVLVRRGIIAGLLLAIVFGTDLLDPGASVQTVSDVGLDGYAIALLGGFAAKAVHAILSGITDALGNVAGVTRDVTSRASTGPEAIARAELLRIAATGVSGPDSQARRAVRSLYEQLGGDTTALDADETGTNQEDEVSGESDVAAPETAENTDDETQG